jgi:NitT/TauT family transport system ATP-binding protein
MTAARLDVTGLSKTYGTGAGAVDALAPVDLAVAAGEIIAIVGPSGCGKTTLLRAIAGLVPPTTGGIDVDGNAVWRDERPSREVLSDVALVFQEPNLLPWLSVEENVALPLRASGVRRGERRQRARELCERTGILGFAKRRPEELSVGMRQRAALARALIAEPRLLLLDEPFAALDAITRDAMNAELAALWQAHPVTTVLVTHSIAEAVFLADRVISMTSRPGSISAETAVPMPRPRDASIQHEPEFQLLVRNLRRELAAVS